MGTRHSTHSAFTQQQLCKMEAIMTTSTGDAAVRLLIHGRVVEICSKVPSRLKREHTEDVRQRHEAHSCALVVSDNNTVDVQRLQDADNMTQRGFHLHSKQWRAHIDVVAHLQERGKRTTA